MKPTLYLDSSVPSYWPLPECDDPIVLARHLLTRRWWDEELPRFDVFVSQIVLDELGAGNEQRAAKREELVRGFQLLDVDEDVGRAAEYYVKNFAMPSRNFVTRSIWPWHRYTRWSIC